MCCDLMRRSENPTFIFDHQLVTRIGSGITDLFEAPDMYVGLTGGRYDVRARRIVVAGFDAVLAASKDHDPTRLSVFIVER